MDSQVFDIISKEAKRQSSTIELIASENHVSSAVTDAVGSCFTNKSVSYTHLTLPTT